MYYYDIMIIISVVLYNEYYKMMFIIINVFMLL